LSLPGSPPSLYLAFEADGGHLSGLGLMLDTLPLGGPVARALSRSPWQLLDDRGVATERGTLRAQPGRGGVQRLAWLDEHAAPDAVEPIAELTDLAGGPYGGQVFVFPPVPSDRRWRCTAPAAIAASLAALLPPEQLKPLSAPLIWVQVPLPPDLTGTASAMQRVAVNAVTVSNIDIVSEQVPFDRMGNVVALQPEGRKGRFLIGVLGITGERGAAYAADAALDVPLDGGRWRYRDGRLDLRPAQNATGRFDTYAMVRLLYCDGTTANGIEPGRVNQLGSPLANVTAKVSSLVPSLGGTPPPAYAPAKVRFAELVRTRERVVTAADAEIAVRAFEPRVRTVRVIPITTVLGGHSRQVQSVQATIHAADFADAIAERPRIEAQLATHLRARAVLGFDVMVEVIING
jgi:hypothetical protein